MEIIFDEMSTTNIRIDVKTKDQLSALGKHGDTFNTIILRLLQEHEVLKLLQSTGKISDEVRSGK